MTGLIIFGAGGLALQIIDSVAPDTRFVTDAGGGFIAKLLIHAFDSSAEGTLVCAVNAAEVRRRITARWQGGFGRVIAASAEVSSHADIGEGTILCRQAIAEAGTSIGAHTHLNLRAAVGHGSRIGAFTTLGPGAIVCGDCTVGDGVRIGAGAIVKEGLTIGDGAVIAMGAVVHRDVPAGCHAVGGRVMPARNAA